MNTAKKQAIFDKIKEYQRIIIFRHFRPDGDAVGSTNGLARILRLSFPEKKIYLCNEDFSDYVAFLGDERAELPDELFGEALGIVIDTATSERISSKKYKLCRELCKIDHHIPVEAYAKTEWVEEERSSASEMIAEFYETFRGELKIDRDAATCIYTGIVTDSGRFRFRSVSADTMRLAGMLLEQGIDIDHLYANLYMKDFSSLKFQSYVLRKMKLTEHGVAHVFISRAAQKRFGLTREDAGTSVSHMESIKNSLIWIAFIEGEDGSIRVRLRSRFVTVSELAQRYHGGGHACAAGATAYSKAEMKRLILDADTLLHKYKSENEGWL